MREARQATNTEDSTEGLYGNSASTIRVTNRTILGALRTRYPYEGFLQTCGVLLVMLVVYGGLLAAIGKDARLPGPVWTVCVVWICAQAAGFVAAKVGLPPPAGMVGVGLLLRNSPGGVLERLPFLWSIKLRFAGLVLVLLQCGLSSHSQVPGQSGRKSALALALLPLVAEAAALGLCLGLWLKMNVFMAFAGALVLAAVCPALVGVTMHEWNQGRLGTRQGIPGWLRRSATWNACLAISGLSLFLGLAVPHQSLGLQIAHGPISIAVGLAAGGLLGFVCALSPIWSSPWRKTVALLVTGELLAFCGITWYFPAAGYLGILAMAGVTSLVWHRSSLSQLCDHVAPGASVKTSQQVQGNLEAVWAGAIQPLVMGLAGASVYIPALPSGTALRALALSAIGLSVRGLSALAVLLSCRFSGSESLVMALVWMSGGSIQATLAAAPLDLAFEYKQSMPLPRPHIAAWAEVIALIGVFSILIGSSMSWLAAALLGPILLNKEEEDLPVQVQPGSPEANENNPFLSSLQQSGISVTGNKDVAMQVLRKTESVEVLGGKHGNPFSDDGSTEGRYDKSPLLIGSANSSYALDTPRRTPSHNPFAAPKHGEYHSLRSVRRITSGDSTGSPLGPHQISHEFGPNRSSQSVPALVRPAKGDALGVLHDDEMTGDERRRTTESFLWENEPMSSAAVLGNSFSGRRRTSSNSFDAASCVWENEPMSAAATLSFVAVPRLPLERVSEVSEVMLEGAPAERHSSQVSSLGRSKLADAVGANVDQAAIERSSGPVGSSRFGVPSLRPHRQAPSPPVQRSSSFPNHKQNEDYLEYEVTSSLTLKETPRSQRRHDVQREIWERQAQAVNLADAASAPDGSPHVSFVLPAFPEVRPAPSTEEAAVTAALQSSPTAEVAAVMDSIMPSESMDLQMAVANSPRYASADQLEESSRVSFSSFDATAALAEQDKAMDADDCDKSALEPTPLMSRPASVMTLFESVDSGAFSEAMDSAGPQDALI